MSPTSLAVREEIKSLREGLLGLGSVVVAWSGGVDSSLLAYVAHDTLGADRVAVLTAVSPSLASVELDDCRRLAEEWGFNWSEVETDEYERAAYRVNAGDRCWHCKDALMDALLPLAEHRGAVVVLGVNRDDLGDHRPGQEAAALKGARFPLLDADLDKAAVRRAAHALGLDVWDKPAAPCLASRLPYGTPVTLTTLSQVEAAEKALRKIGFTDLRVRHYGTRARIEFAAADLSDALVRSADVRAAVRAAGYVDVDIDPDGLRSGNLNDALHSGRPHG